MAVRNGQSSNESVSARSAVFNVTTGLTEIVLAEFMETHDAEDALLLVESARDRNPTLLPRARVSVRTR
ncbi:hypothetical protein D8S78_20200 [Natrialba swarupiae]|nr:hypothetical protein [Natrialba swarupiae]